MRTYIGIDPGSKGFITVHSDDGYQFVSIEENTPPELGRKLAGIRDRYPDALAVMEEVHAIYGSSAKGTFSFGEIFGLLQGLLIATRIPYHLVQPKEWQREIWVNADKVYKSGAKVDTKATSLNAAQRLFPDIDLRRTPACRKVDDNKVDSLLLAEFARRKNL